SATTSASTTLGGASATMPPTVTNASVTHAIADADPPRAAWEAVPATPAATASTPPIDPAQRGRDRTLREYPAPKRTKLRLWTEVGLAETCPRRVEGASHRILRLLGDRERVHGCAVFPELPRSQSDDRHADPKGERDLRERAELAADRDQRVGCGSDEDVAGLTHAGRDRVGEVCALIRAVAAREDADRDAAFRSSAPRDRVHDAAEAA